MGTDWVTPLYKSGAAVFRTLPRPVSEVPHAEIRADYPELTEDQMREVVSEIEAALR